MAQETWALKLDAELKEKLQEIIKSDFNSSRDFMENVISLYELNKLKQDENILASEIEELERLSRRINGIFINANAKINTMLQDKDSKAEQQSEKKNQLIERLQDTITNLEKEKENISSINDTLVNSNNEYLQQVNQLTKSNQTLEELVTEYKEKSDTLTDLLAEYKQDREQNKALQEQLKELQDKINELNAVSTEQANRILLADTEKEAHKNEIQQLSAKYNKDLDLTKLKFELEMNTKLLELKEEYQYSIQTLQEKHNTEIEQYQHKYRELLEQLEHQKTSKSKGKTKEQSEINKSN